MKIEMMQTYLKKRLRPLVRDVVISEMLKKGWTHCPLSDHWVNGASIGVDSETGQKVGCRACILERGSRDRTESTAAGTTELG